MGPILKTTDGQLLAILRQELVNITEDPKRDGSYRESLRVSVIPALDRIIQKIEATEP